MQQELSDSWTATGVLDLVRSALADSGRGGVRVSTARAHLQRARDLQRRFRSEPVGGKLGALKKLAYWWTASAFDRQAKAVEALLDAFAELLAEHELRTTAAAAGVVATDPGDEGDPRPPAIPDVPAEMLTPERMLLYSLVYALRPRCCLEIGTHHGGSAALICAALGAAGQGRLVCVDPAPQILPQADELMAGRATVLSGTSPEILPHAREVAGEPFDFALIDGDHSRAGVLRDAAGVLPHLAEQAYLLFHDCHHAAVAAGIDDALAHHPELVDAGTLSTTRNPSEETDDAGRPVVWGGLRLVRYRR